MNTSSRQKARTFLALAIAAFVIVHVFSRFLPGVLETWNAQILDRFFLIRSSIPSLRPPYDGKVVHIDLNDTAVQQLKTFYLTRSHYAQVIRNLAAMRVASQAYDFIFAAETSQSDDQAMIGATSEAGNVYYGMALGLAATGEARTGRIPPEVNRFLDSTKWRVNVEGGAEGLFTGIRPLITFPLLAGASRGIGFLSLQTDRDGVIRRVPLLVRYMDSFYPSLPFRLACDYLGVSPEKITIKPGQYIRLHDAREPGGAQRDILIPIDDHGAMIINFIGPWGTMRHHNFAQIYFASGDRDDMEIWTEELSGKIAVISDVSTGATDLGPVPVDVNFPLSGLHANVLQTILSGQFLKEVTGSGMLAVELLMLAAIFLMSLRFSPVLFVAGCGSVMAAYSLGALSAFLAKGLLLNVVRPVITAGAAASLILAFRYFRDAKEKEALRRSFESYFPPSVVKKILANPGMINKGQRKELTVLFSDIKDFTSYSSTCSPDHIRGFLNEYFESMVDVVFAHQGTVDKYIGDGLMVFFGDPEPAPDHALRAVKAAIFMQKRTAELAQKWLQEGGFPLHIRIGINTGEVIVGNMGSSKRLSYTVLGAPVNLAKRLESAAPVDGILISERTHQLIAPAIPARFFGAIQVKGISDPVSTYEVVIEGLRNEKSSVQPEGGS
ncbi:MAG: CHASE2 domain-containing protein [Syntrophobacteraceae bacterium]